ncbi:MAG: DUF983 domain-containing protein [Sphingobium sp.]|nr:DUF983 domain-containing protein [Sphingobium sp.]
MREPQEQAVRPLRPALMLGLCGKCPACGEGRIFARFLKSADHCQNCGQKFTGHQADDLPAYIVILLVGHILVALMIEINHIFNVPLHWQIIIWPLAATVIAVALIQPVKGAVIALQWARRMHGFAQEKAAE